MRHLLVVQGGAGLDKVLGVGLSLLGHLQEPGSLDQRLQGVHSAPCVNVSAAQPLLQLTHIVAERRDKTSTVLLCISF